MPGPGQAGRSDHPDIRPETVASNEASDLLRREADIALGNFRPTEPGLVARRLAHAQAGLYASQAYARELGAIETPDDLARACFVTVDDGTLIEHIRFNPRVRIAFDALPAAFS